MRRCAVLLAPLALLAAPLAARAQTPTTPTTPAPAASITLRIQHLFGQPFLATGSKLTVHGTLAPSVAGQTVTVTFSRDGRTRASHTVTVGAGGRFVVRYASPKAGLVSFTATHAATTTLGAASATGPVRVRFVSPNMPFGSRGPAVWVLQRHLAALHFYVPQSSVYDLGTQLAVEAYRKMLGLARVYTVDGQVLRELSRGRGVWHVRYSGDGRHVEADLSKQLLALINPHGKVYDIFQVSSGKPSTPTVLGRFSVYEQSPGYNSEGMYFSSYFIRGYAIHGYDPSPTYPASHGCLRLPISDAIFVYGWLRVGTPVDVYYEDGRASAPISDHAGP
ncbi:MAG TPA: L,D-transpeptidase [Solirubrobacteraceae bacterium]|jgi:hypothetical protein|nr:L,D-transpeptidase [Solirubrobacteraceae bacterium]